MSCNLANFFTGLPYFSIHTWVFAIFMIAGIYLGTKIVAMPFLTSKAKLIKQTIQLKIQRKKSKNNVLSR